MILGICCDDNKLYCVEKRDNDSRNMQLSVHDISTFDHYVFRLLGKVQLECKSNVEVCHPRADRHSRRIYVPCVEDGVKMFRFEDKSLMTLGTLKCVKTASSIAVNSADTVFISDKHYITPAIYLVNVRTDTVIMMLEKSQLHPADYLAVTGKTVLAWHGLHKLMTYARDGSTPGQVLQTPEGLRSVTSITTDGQSNFLVTDAVSRSVFVLDDNTRIWHKIHTDNKILIDCDVHKSSVWLAGDSNHVYLMRSQSNPPIRPKWYQRKESGYEYI